MKIRFALLLTAVLSVVGCDSDSPVQTGEDSGNAPVDDAVSESAGDAGTEGDGPDLDGGIDRAADLDFEPVALDQVRRVVVVGDHGASNPGATSSSASLLIANDNDQFPAFAGADLETLLPGLQVVRLDRGGDSYHALASLEVPWCTCSAGTCPEEGRCLDVDSEAPTLVVVHLGLNDLLFALIQLFTQEALQEDPQPLLDAFRADVAAVFSLFDNRELFHNRPLILVTTPFDSSDGVGDLAEIVARFYPAVQPEALTAEVVRIVFAEVNLIVRDEAERHAALLADIHPHFLGHGYHFDDETHENHHAADPTIWVRYLMEPNLRGGHEMRRVMWSALTGEEIDDVPTVATESAETPVLPTITDDGWANAVVVADLTERIEGDLDYPNLGADPELIVGQPGGSAASSVAVGVVGASIVVDLGEGEEAVDGEGADLLVLELDANQGGAPEPYRVSVANDPDGPFIFLADSRGTRTFDLAESGMQTARYVKIESQAHVVDVLGGFGSPLYPGPEIDAVGAVYPGSTQ